METFACEQCGAAVAFDGVRTATCPYCASASFVERPAAPGRPEPELVVTFVGGAEVARRALARWLGRRTWFADPALRRARVEDLRGVYVPAYLYSAAATTEYTAQIGESYTETERVEVADRDGTKRMETRPVTRTEYRELAGHHVGYVSDVVVGASAGLSDAELARIEPFDLRRVRRFSPALVTGWITEEVARPLEACREACRTGARDRVGDVLRRFMPGDGFSDLAWRTTLRWEAMQPILVPVWMFAVRYREDRPPLRVAINGQTGQVGGKVPLAWWKLVLAALALGALVAAIVWFARRA